MELEPIIKVDKLVKTYDGNNVVDGVSFEVKKGEIFGILGPTTPILFCLNKDYAVTLSRDSLGRLW